MKYIAIEQLINLRKKAKSGDVKACQLLLEMAGMYTQKQELVTTHKGVIQMPAKVPVGTPITPTEADSHTGLRVESKENKELRPTGTDGEGAKSDSI